MKLRHQAFGCGWGFAVLVSAAGCFDPPVAFRATASSAAGSATTAGPIAEAFGTPDLPQVPVSLPLDARLVAQAAGPVGNVSLEHRRGLYRQHCAICHGIGGQGDGPAASVLSTEPRNFALGAFKYRSIEGEGLPTRADLRKVVEQGVPGTAMPSFALVPAAEREALVEYVRYLAMRGMAELQLGAGGAPDHVQVLKSLGDQWRSVDPDHSPTDSEST